MTVDCDKKERKKIKGKEEEGWKERTRQSLKT